ncbi:hyastatin-like [Macrobrachium nipponense]|uniref:hyastatin-like n=1 Tax=Macrobrachium nipponense TaxID=159736 RepID=UPI0030C8CC5A
MKGLLIICCLTAVAFAQDKNAGNKRFFGGLNQGFGGGFGGVDPGFGGGFGGGINPGFGGGFGGVSNTCRRWCRTPEGQAYCCETNNEPDTLPFVKPGVCPPAPFALIPHPSGPLPLHRHAPTTANAEVSTSAATTGVLRSTCANPQLGLLASVDSVLEDNS